VGDAQRTDSKQETEMRLLIAVKSCCSDANRSYHKTIRDTWGKDTVALGIDLRFFVGEGILQSEGTEDVVQLAIKDDYQSLPYKTREICRYAVARGYDYVLLCDTDTYIIPRLLLQVGFEKYDYYGLIQRPLGQAFSYDAIDRHGAHHPGTYYPWASGGFGYFLSKRAANIIAHVEPDSWAEDLWVGQVMNEQYNHGRLTIGDAKNMVGQCTWHFPQVEYKSGYDLKFGWMEKMYREHR
jgi:hypothetical protein